MARALVPEDLYRRNGDAALSSLSRAALASAWHALHPHTAPVEQARAAWPDDRVVPLILRAASSPATIADAAALRSVAVTFAAALTPLSAGAAILERAGLTLTFDHAGSISVPAIAMPGAGFVGEGQPMPVVGGSTTGTLLRPYKLGVIAALTSEMLSSSDAETLVRTAMVESTAASLDAVLLDDQPAVDELRPSGLRFGVTGLTPAAAGADAMLADLAALASAVAPLAGSGTSGIAIVAAPSQAVSIVLRSPREPAYAVFASAGLADGMVIAIALPALASAVGVPAIEASRDAAVHMETSPAQIVTAAGAVAVPVASLFQTDSVALRLRWPLSWATRAPGTTAWMEAVTW
jgi:hypothetical protein